MDNKTGVVILAIAAVGAGAAYLLLRKKGTRSILEDLFPEGFTATEAQLDILVAAGYPVGSRVYDEAVHIAYNDVAATCPGQDVSWNEELGYYCMG